MVSQELVKRGGGKSRVWEENVLPYSEIERDKVRKREVE